jgi:aldehyde:ferredoxin oxidoreductase
MELYESGYLPEQDLGYAMGFGNTKAMMALLKKTAVREDFGDVLAEGGKFVAEKYGHPELFMGIKGMGMPAWHPQGVPIIGLQYATNNVGGSHTKATLPFYDGRRDPAEHINGPSTIRTMWPWWIRPFVLDYLSRPPVGGKTSGLAQCDHRTGLR